MKKILIRLLLFVSGSCLGRMFVKLYYKRLLEREIDYSQKHLSLFLMMTQWVEIKQQGKNVCTYFEKMHLNNIAIYGMSYAGKALIDELEGSEIAVKYAIDRNAKNLRSNLNLVTPEETFEKVDAIVVTAIRSFYDIEKELSSKIDCPIISLESILYEV